MNMRDLITLCEDDDRIWPLVHAHQNPSPFSRGFEAFWIDDMGDVHVIPHYGCHEDAAFFIFAKDMNDGETDYKGIAIDRGWIRVVLRGTEMNLEFSQACSSKAIRAVMKFLPQAPSIQVIHIEFWTGTAEGGRTAEQQMKTEPRQLGGVLRSLLK
jgi:hypothetical protein